MKILAPCIKKGQTGQKVIVVRYAQLAGRVYDVLAITNERRKTERYRLEEFYSELPGRAFRLEKLDGEVYCCLAHEDPAQRRCTCLGFEKSGHCKHVAALAVLCAGGLIDDPRRSPADPDDFPAQSDPAPCERCGAPVDDPFEFFCEPCRCGAAIGGAA